MNFTRGLATLTVALAVCLVWWIIRPMKEQPAPVTAASAPAMAPAPAPIVIHPAPPQPVQVAAPVVPPAPVQESAPEPAPAAPAPADPRLAPDTAIADLTRMIDSGDYVTAAATYVNLPPNVQPEQFVAQLQQNPNFPQLVQMVRDTMQATQSVQPVYNDAGDTATYTFPVPVDGQSSVRWRKVGTQWFLDALGGGN